MLAIYVLAQAVAAATPEAAAAPTQGVISYPASYFASQQPANAADMINRVPGFSLDTGSSVRGFEGAAGNALIDGQRPASKTDNIEEMLRRIPASQVERIDVIRGGAPGIDMQGKTVLANVIRKKGGGLRGLFAFSENHAWDGRTAGAARLEASGGSGQRKWELGSFYGKGLDDGSADGPAIHIFGDGSPPVRSRLRSEGDGVDGRLTGVYETPLFGGQARVNGRIATNKWKFDEENIFIAPATGAEIYNEIDNTVDAELGGAFTRRLGERTELDLVALRQDRTKDFTARFVTDAETSQFALDRESSETIGRAVLKYRFTDTLSVEGGGEVALNRLDSETRLAVDGAPVDLPAGNVQVEEDRNEVFGKATWRPLPAWTVDGGLRYESSTISSSGDVVLEKTLHFLKPRLAVAWAASETTQLRVRIEREVGQLNFDDFVATSRFNTSGGVSAGNPDLDPQQAWVGEAAIEQRFWGGGVIVLTARYFELKDVIDRGPVFSPGGDVFDRPQNIGDGTKQELALELTLPLDRLGLTGAQIRGDVTKRWSEVTDPTTGDTREISGLKPLEWTASFIHDVPALRLSWGVDAFGAWRQTYYRYNLVETVKLRTFVKPFLEWRPVADINIRFELPNVTGRDLRRTLQIYPGPRNQGGVPDIIDRLNEPGRMFYFRVRKTFGA